MTLTLQLFSFSLKCIQFSANKIKEMRTILFMKYLRCKNRKRDHFDYELYFVFASNMRCIFFTFMNLENYFFTMFLGDDSRVPKKPFDMHLNYVYQQAIHKNPKHTKRRYFEGCANI